MSDKTLVYVGGAVALGGAVVLISSYLGMPDTGVAQMERPGIKIPVFVLSKFNSIDARLVLALMHNESLGDPRNFVGDVALGGGPSIGPMQVYRSTAKAFKLWTPSGGDLDERAEYASMKDDVWQGIGWGIAVLKDALRQSGGDVAKAFAIYNGGPRPGAAAQAYSAKAMAFLTDQLDWSNDA
jgi:hypothetical protein